MITRFGTAPRRTGLDSDGFQKYWLEIHGPLIAQHLRNAHRYWQNHPVLKSGETLLPWPGFDACAEMQFDDVAAMQASVNEPTYREVAKRDSERLIDMSKVGLTVAERVHAIGRTAAAGVRLMTFMRCAPQRAMQELRDALEATPKATRAFAREAFVSLEGPGAPVSDFDAVDVQWFEAAADAELYVASSEAREHRWEIAHLVRGVERVIVRAIVFI